MKKSTIETMKLIVGLGNYGKKYDKTRHNFGFMAIDYLANNLNWKDEKKFFGQMATGEIAGEKTVFLKPETYMNLSGKAVLAVAQFYKIPAKKVFVFSDDLDLPFGKFRFREKGGAGGHNGLKSIISVLNTQDFPRMKFGIGNELRKKIPTENFVLTKFSAKELKIIPEITEKAMKEFLIKI
jgi:PTH1 family peptidyl-tRNA hydrolase